MIRCFLATIIFFSSHSIFLFFPYKSMSPFLLTTIFSILIFPLFCSLHKNKIFYYFKNNFFKTAKLGFILGTILVSCGIIISIAFSISLKFSKILAIFITSVECTALLMFFSKLSFIPFFLEKNTFDVFLYSFKTTKKYYHKIFAVTLKTYFMSLLIFPIPFALKNYINSIKNIYIKSIGGDDGIRTHDLLNAIQTRSQLRHAPKDIFKTKQFEVYQNKK